MGAAVELELAGGDHLFAAFQPAEWHVLLHLAQASATVGTALQHWQRYARLASDMEQVRLQRDGERWIIDLCIDAPPELERCLVEHYSVMAIGVLRQGAGAIVNLSSVAGQVGIAGASITRSPIAAAAPRIA